MTIIPFFSPSLSLLFPLACASGYVSATLCSFRKFYPHPHIRKKKKNEVSSNIHNTNNAPTPPTPLDLLEKWCILSHLNYYHSLVRHLPTSSLPLSVSLIPSRIRFSAAVSTLSFASTFESLRYFLLQTLQ